MTLSARLLFKACALPLFLIVSAPFAYAQWERQESGTTVRLRGISSVSPSVAWASGDKGTYTRTTDGGKTWQAGRVPGAEELDFRDVDAFSADTAYLLSIGEGEKSRIYRTDDGGLHWTLQFKNSRSAAFFDSMAFWDRDHGIAVSDPVDGRFLIITTSDGGKNWKEMPPDKMPPALEGEGAFAASGTCIAVSGSGHAWFGTGGPGGARVFRSDDRGRSWKVATTPLTAGKSAGVFSVLFLNARRGVVVGGDYAKEKEVGINSAWTEDGGRTWHATETKRPNGYRSCVALSRVAEVEMLIAVGPTGSDYSLSRGKSWSVLADEGFHAMSFAAGTLAGWAVGEGGRIARYR